MKQRRVTEGPEIGTLTQRHDALLVLDVDEVVLHFIAPFEALLGECGARLHPDSFKLTGNVRSLSTGTALTGHELDQVTERLYREQEERQTPVEGVHEALAALSAMADIVFLTAMTPEHYPARRRLLDTADLRFPMIATERSKGAVVAELAERWRGPLVFVDDLPPNLVSVRRSVPQARLVHLMANRIFRAHLPQMAEDVHRTSDWREASKVIHRIINETGTSRLPAGAPRI